ncbi:nitrous oxide reductase accessory protein NosL [Haloferax namakaokahaiae]|uniref:Nitrous oxide reductase accessory protein NosL n=1 Tax=Haloferax namakaokahaiae TaxID=1748331 RepID=A0ABD5ZJK1_9EURY
MPHDPSDESSPAPMATRRSFTTALSGTALAALAGCIGTRQSESVPDPIDLGGEKTDDQGGMVIGLHAGPNGQIFYRDNAPKGHGNPAWFHTLSMGLFPYYFEHERMGWTAEVVYVTDYSTVDYELTEEDGRLSISTHTAAETFGDATMMTYVVDSEVLGGMGAELIPFSDTADAEAFASEHEGDTVEFDDVTPEWLDGYMRS